MGDRKVERGDVKERVREGVGEGGQDKTCIKERRKQRDNLNTKHSDL
jgi:hypothetical protein